MRVRTRLDRLERHLEAISSTDSGLTIQQVLDAIDTDPLFPSSEWIELHRELCVREHCEPPQETDSVRSAIVALEPAFVACMARLQARINALGFDRRGPGFLSRHGTSE